MTKLKGLILTEGMHGMISQAEGLAKALDLNFFHKKIELNNFWKLMPSKFTPVKRFIFKNYQYLYYYLKLRQQTLYDNYQKGNAQPSIDINKMYKEFYVPIISKEIQEKIYKEIEEINNENQVISKTVEIKTHLVVRGSTLKL